MVRKLLAVFNIIVLGIFIMPFSVGGIHKRNPKNVSVTWSIFHPLLVLFKWGMWIQVWLLAFVFLVVSVITKNGWFMKVSYSLDQLGNTVANGHQDYTFSGRLGEKIKSGKANYFEKVFCKSLSALDPTSDAHCVDSIGY